MRVDEARRVEWESDVDAVGFYERMGARHVRDSAVTGLGRILPVMARDSKGCLTSEDVWTAFARRLAVMQCPSATYDH
jgi:hypothetical protein